MIFTIRGANAEQIAKCSKAEHLFNLQHFPNCILEDRLLAPHSPAPEPIRSDTAILQKILDDIEIDKIKKNCGHQVMDYKGNTKIVYEKKWMDMREQYKEYFRKHGYIPVRFNQSIDDFEVVIPSVGRPMVARTKKITKNIRINETMNQALDDYCETNNIDASKAIRIALQNLFAQKQ